MISRWYRVTMSFRYLGLPSLRCTLRRRWRCTTLETRAMLTRRRRQLPCSYPRTHETGAELRCAVTSREENKVTCKIHNEFTINVCKPVKCWEKVVVGEMIVVKVEHVTMMADKSPFILGNIVFDNKDREDFIEIADVVKKMADIQPQQINNGQLVFRHMGPEGQPIMFTSPSGPPSAGPPPGKTAISRAIAPLLPTNTQSGPRMGFTDPVANTPNQPSPKGKQKMSPRGANPGPGRPPA